MILSGRYLGEIIDAFGTIAERAEVRAIAGGLTDFHRMLENFLMTILNELNDSTLQNTNRERNNSAGIDLYDADSKTGFQITTVGTTQKINDTLRVVQERIIGAEKLEIKTLNVLVIGKKQRSYSLDTKLCQALNFNEKENIWDIITLSQKLIGIKPDVLKNIYDYVMRELTRVRIELELPDNNGEYPTDLGQYMELRPSGVLGNCSKLKAFCLEKEFYSSDDFDKAIVELREYFQELVTTQDVLGKTKLVGDTTFPINNCSKA